MNTTTNTSPTRAEPVATPRVLRTLLGLLLAVAALLWATGASAVADARRATQAVGRDSVPSVIAAQEIRAALARANACAVRAVQAPPAFEAAEWASYTEALSVASDRVVTAAQNITYPEERPAIVTIIERTHAFSALVGAARAQGDAASLRRATQIMRDEILPAADALDRANFQHLDAGYHAAREATSSGLAGVVVLVVLLGAQTALAIRFRRLVNPPLAAATVVAIFALAQVGGGLGRARAALRTARTGAFDSIHALSKARAIAQDARTDESFFLFGGLASDEQAFSWREVQIVAGSADDQMLANAAAGRTLGLNGYLGDATRNVTFRGEREAMVGALGAFREYRAAHERLRKPMRTGKRDEAALLAFGEAAPVPVAFERLDAAIERAIQINRAEFGRLVQASENALDGLPRMVACASIAVGALSWLGLRARMKEFHA